MSFPSQPTQSLPPGALAKTARWFARLPLPLSTCTQRCIATILAFFLLILVEWLRSTAPLAASFQTLYSLAWSIGNSLPLTAWLGDSFLPHVETSSVLMNMRAWVGTGLAIGAFTLFCITAVWSFLHKQAHKTALTGGVYRYIRHPQYTFLSLGGFGALLLYPRYVVLVAYIAMLFACYILSRIEEHECKLDFGQLYLDYKNRTGMFLPISIPCLRNLPRLPRRGLKRLCAIVGLYGVVAATAVGTTNWISAQALNSLSVYFTHNSAYVAVGDVDRASLQQVAAITAQNVQIQSALGNLADSANAKYIHFVSAAPQNAEQARQEDGYASHARFKVVLTRAEIDPTRSPTGRDILFDALRPIPLLEIVVDLNQNEAIPIHNLLERVAENRSRTAIQ